MQEKTAGRLDPFLIALGVLLLYLSFPSFLHLFDGVACAIAVELGDLKHLLHGNHLIYGLFGFLFHRLLLLVGVNLSALWSLQLLDSILGAVSAGLLASILRERGLGRFASALCGLGMAVSHAYWKWSVEANVYQLGVFFLLLTLREALSPRPGPYRLALCHALAMLAHSANALFAPVALFAIWRTAGSGREPRMDTARYLVCAAAAVVAAYVAAAVLWIQPETVGDVKLWLLGSGALGPGRTWQWQGSELMLWRVLDWIVSSGRAVCANPLLGAPLWAAALAAPLLARGEDWPLVLSGWLWLPAYGALFLFWQPFNLIYRVSDLPALWLLAAPMFDRMAGTDEASQAGRKYGRSVLAAYLAVVFAANLNFVFLPNARPENNDILQEALWIGSVTPEAAWVAAADTDQVYLPYFAHRRPLNLNYYRGREAALAGRIQELQGSGEPVFISERILGLGWREVFQRIGLEAGPRSGKSALYRISRF